MLRLQKNITDGLRLGELITGSGLVDEDALEAALNLARASRLPLGRVLVSIKHLTTAQVEQLIVVQRQARAGAFSVHEARRQALLSARGQTEPSYQSNFEPLVEESFIEQETNYALLTLLNRAGIVNSREVAHYLEMSIREDIPCGRMLVLHRRITPSFRRYCLELLGRFRQGRISLDHAVEECRRIREASLHGVPTELQEQPDVAVTRLGQVLLRTDVIDDIHLYDALEVSLSNDRRLGDVLVESGLISAMTLKHCLEITAAINAGGLSQSITTESIKKLYVSKARAALKPAHSESEEDHSHDGCGMNYMALAAC